MRLPLDVCERNVFDPRPHPRCVVFEAKFPWPIRSPKRRMMRCPPGWRRHRSIRNQFVAQIH
eukprot:2051715-Prymnesium_polylepis.1